jgi:sulfoxide reductase heme-binding subunit YedZ
VSAPAITAAPGAPRARRAKPLPWLEPGVLVGGLTPLLSIAQRAATGELGADPIAQALNELGLVALVFLVASLACTPAKILFGWTWPLRIRRMLGVFAAVYAALHVLTYVVLDQGFDWSAILKDVLERKFIFVGAATFVLLVPLALTSTNGAVRRLGFARWKRLHRLAYAAGVLGVVHFFLRVKKDVSEPQAYGIALATLFLVRVAIWLRDREAQRPQRSPIR